MKKVVTSCFFLIAILLFAGCGNKISKQDLQANDWLIEANQSNDLTMLVSFSEKVASFSVDTSKIETSASGTWESMGAELGKKMLAEMSYNVNYTLEKNQLTWTKDKTESKYRVSKEDKNIILTPDKSNSSKNKEKLVLKPTKKKAVTSTEHSSTLETTSTTETAESAESTEVATNITTTESTIPAEPQATLSDFVGGWGVPYSGNLFFINPDGTFSSRNVQNEPLGDFSFSTLSDGRAVMITKIGELIKENDGSLTNHGQNYQYLGNVTMEQYISDKDQAVANTTEPTVEQSSEVNQEPVYDTISAEGEGLAQFARRNGITLDQLFQLNPSLTPASPIEVGQRLRVK